MADPLVELDEVIEKAKGLIRGGSKRTFRAVARRGKNAEGPTGSEWGKRGRELSPKSRVRDAANYLAGRFKGGYRPGSSRKFSDIRSGVYKSTAPLEALDSAIEKARGLIPKGGSSKLRNALWRRAERNQKRGGGESLNRSIRATSYLSTRKPNGRVASRFKGYVEARQSKNYK